MTKPVVAALVLAAALLTAKLSDTAQLTGWITDPTPLLQLGVATGPEIGLLSDVNAVLRLRDGSILVSDCGETELKLFSKDGLSVTRVGRAGQGPGEFSRITGMFRGNADSILVTDNGLARISVYSPEGVFVRTIRNAEGHRPNGYAVAVGQFPDGELLMRRLVGLKLPRAPQPDRFLSLERWSAEGTPRDTLTRTFMFSTDSILASGDTLERKVYAAQLRDGYVVGSDDKAELRYYSHAGELQRIVPNIGRIVPLGNAFREAQIRANQAVAPDSTRERLRQYMLAQHWPRNFGAFGPVVAGMDGRVWVQDPSRGERIPRSWTAIRDGVVSGRVLLPRGFDAMAFGSTWVLGVVTDSVGVKTVQMLQLVPSAGVPQFVEQTVEHTVFMERTCNLRL